MQWVRKSNISITNQSIALAKSVNSSSAEHQNLSEKSSNHSSNYYGFNSPETKILGRGLKLLTTKTMR